MTVKRLNRTALVAALAAFLWASAEADTCNMTLAATHSDANNTRIYAAPTGLPALYFQADMDVNTDGAARSYHPDDPRGQTKAFNNIANAISKIYDADGNDITCSPRRGDCYTTFMDTFEAARDANYDPEGNPRFETRWMIPWQLDETLGHQVPCTIESGPNAGFFVSQTSVIVDGSASECDQGRYLDSLAINANVLPMSIDWRSQGILTDKTDLVVARDRVTGNLAYAINGDRGPATKIGEGSIALAAAMSGTVLDGSETYREIRAMARTDVDYLIFPTKDIRRLTGGAFTQADIDRFGAEAFQDWGGIERLDACKDLAR